MFKYLKCIPTLEKLATDLEAAVDSPQDQAVAADIRALIAEINSAPAPETGSPVSTQTPPAAA